MNLVITAGQMGQTKYRMIKIKQDLPSLVNYLEQLALAILIPPLIDYFFNKILSVILNAQNSLTQTQDRIHINIGQSLIILQVMEMKGVQKCGFELWEWFNKIIFLG